MRQIFVLLYFTDEGTEAVRGTITRPRSHSRVSVRAGIYLKNAFIPDEEDVVHTYSRILLSHKKERNNAICSNVDVPRDAYTKRSKSERERQIPYAITSMWNLKYDTNELIYKTETDSQT